MRNNVSNPSIGHVIMFGAVSMGWLVLFLITLAGEHTSTFLIKAVFSGVFMLASAVGTVLLLRKVLQQKKSAKQG